MIRHADLTFTRPIPESEIVKKIESGEVTARDEIAPATGYWFSLQEVDEVKRFFGEDILLKALIPDSAETTSSTNTALLVKTPRGKALFSKAPFVVEPPPHVKIIEAKTDTAGPARLVFGGILVAIFVGTLLLLWMGSQ